MSVNPLDPIEVSLERIADSLAAIETHLADLKAQPEGQRRRADPECPKCHGTGVIACDNYACVPF